MKFGENLKVLRNKKNISQEELAELVGVSRQSVSKWETSLAYPEMKYLLKLFAFFLLFFFLFCKMKKKT